MPDCFFLTPDELATYLAGGYTLLGGPYSTQDDCLAACSAGSGDSGSGSGDSGSGSGDSGSGSGDSGSGDCGIVDLPLGYTYNTSVNTLTLTAVSVTNALLIVNAGVYNPTPDTVANVTYNGVSMSRAMLSAGALDAEIWYLHVTGAVTGDIVVSTATSSDIFLTAIQVTGLVHNTPDITGFASGASSTPDVGSAGPTVDACEYVQSCFLMNFVTTGGSWTFNSPFTNSQTVWNTGSTMALSDGSTILSTTGTFDAGVSANMICDFGAVEVSFK